MSERDARLTEEALDRRPGDVRARSKLIDYYTQRSMFGDRPARDRVEHHLRVLVRSCAHAPELGRQTLFHAGLGMSPAHDQFDEWRSRWLRAVGSEPGNPHVLRNAVDFLAQRDKETSNRLLGQAIAVEREVDASCPLSCGGEPR